eukprot:gnl/TRDRNA2_/TRDRNA2_136817_c0_seq1.p1 gnl/TRDRNA2_/TRDRNA2_136817_c0~~gnl/TRDRNA2_/TRDRNA2_136817_c0_seq1.p1  ORF type:complete len:443 (-),score=82.12 gnl/TRDRNA2_/TRDRNA2_136817_c0_seq1:123-1451(-)
MSDASVETIKPPGCVNCAEKSDVYCVNCAKPLCRFCVSLLHHPTTVTEAHSIEEIDKARKGVQIITPILVDLCVLWVLSIGLAEIAITKEYFDHVSHCPTINYGRRMVAKYDANLFYYYKASIATYCDIEDSYWRLLVDTYARAILTGTDSWLLILSAFPKAFLFEEVIRILGAPLAAAPYALIALIMYRVERLVPKSPIFVHLEKIMIKMSLAKRLALIGKAPPPTLVRSRPASDFMEKYRYMKGRYSRRFDYHVEQCLVVLRFFLKCTVWGALYIRVACMLLGRQIIRPVLLPLMRLVGLKATMEQHQALFSAATGIENESQAHYASDWLLLSGLQSAFNAIPFEKLLSLVNVKMATSVGGQIFAWLPMFIILGVLYALLSTPMYLWKKVLAKQQKAFVAKWSSHYCQAIWGECSREHQCDWQKLRFDDYDKVMGREAKK